MTLLRRERYVFQHILRLQQRPELKCNDEAEEEADCEQGVVRVRLKWREGIGHSRWCAGLHQRCQ